MWERSHWWYPALPHTFSFVSSGAFDHSCVDAGSRSGGKRRRKWFLWNPTDVHSSLCLYLLTLCFLQFSHWLTNSKMISVASHLQWRPVQPVLTSLWYMKRDTTWEVIPHLQLPADRDPELLITQPQTGCFSSAGSTSDKDSPECLNWSAHVQDLWRCFLYQVEQTAPAVALTELQLRNI